MPVGRRSVGGFPFTPPPPRHPSPAPCGALDAACRQRCRSLTPEYLGGWEKGDGQGGAGGNRTADAASLSARRSPFYWSNRNYSAAPQLASQLRCLCMPGRDQN